MKTRYLLTLLSFAALPLVPAHADIAGFGTGAGYSLNQGQNAAGPTITNGVATLTSGANYQGNSIFYGTKQNVSAFNVSFTYQDVGANGSTNTADGFTFTLQNDSRGSGAVGYDGNQLGYGAGNGSGGLLGTGEQAQVAISPSLAIGFNVYQNSRTGLGTNGTLSLTNTSAALLYSGHPINITLAYNGTTLTETLTDSTVPANTSTFTYTANLASTLGGTTAYVGFTGADGSATSTQTISNFNFTVVPEPSTWAASALGLGLCAVAVLRRRPGTAVASK